MIWRSSLYLRSPLISLSICARDTFTNSIKASLRQRSDVKEETKRGYANGARNWRCSQSGKQRGKANGSRERSCLEKLKVLKLPFRMTLREKEESAFHFHSLVFFSMASFHQWSEYKPASPAKFHSSFSPSCYSRCIRSSLLHLSFHEPVNLLNRPPRAYSSVAK